MHFNIKVHLHLGFSLFREEYNLMWIPFKYEKLSSFCLICGRITHTMGTCIDDEHPYQVALGEKLRGMISMEEMEYFGNTRPWMGQGGLGKGRGIHGRAGRGDGGDGGPWWLERQLSSSLMSSEAGDFSVFSDERGMSSRLGGAVRTRQDSPDVSHALTQQCKTSKISVGVMAVSSATWDDGLETLGSRLCSQTSQKNYNYWRY